MDSVTLRCSRDTSGDAFSARVPFLPSPAEISALPAPLLQDILQKCLCMPSARPLKELAKVSRQFLRVTSPFFRSTFPIEEPPPIAELPKELVFGILEYVNHPADLARCMQVSSGFKRFVEAKLIRDQDTVYAVRILQIIYGVGNKADSLHEDRIKYEELSATMSHIWKADPSDEMRVFFRSTVPKLEIKSLLNLILRHLHVEELLEKVLSPLDTRQESRCLQLHLRLYSKDIKNFLITASGTFLGKRAIL